MSHDAQTDLLLYQLLNPAFNELGNILAVEDSDVQLIDPKKIFEETISFFEKTKETRPASVYYTKSKQELTLKFHSMSGYCGRAMEVFAEDFIRNEYEPFVFEAENYARSSYGHFATMKHFLGNIYALPILRFLIN